MKSNVPHLALLVLVAGLSVASTPSLAQTTSQQPSQPAGPVTVQAAQEPATNADGKPIITRLDQLPAHQYALPVPPSATLLRDTEFNDLMARVKANTLADLAASDIREPRIAIELHGVLASIAIIEGDLAEAQRRFDLMRSIETRESGKLLMGVVMMTAARASMTHASNAFLLRTSFEDDLRARLASMPQDVIATDLQNIRTSADVLSRDFIIARASGTFDGIWESNNQQVAGNVARALVGMRASMIVMAPLARSTVNVIDAVTNVGDVPTIDAWDINAVNLEPTESLSPVLVAIWDSGVDSAALPGSMWINKSEQPNGRDDDGNGYIDDIHGIGFDLRSQPVTNALMDISLMRCEPTLVQRMLRGLMDIQSRVPSPEGLKVDSLSRRLSNDAVGALLSDVNLYSTYIRGTFLAGVATSGNPFARVMSVRRSFEVMNTPEVPPTPERSAQLVKQFGDSVAYMRQAGVRVVNISWTTTLGRIERELMVSGMTESAKYKPVARQLLDAERKGFADAVASAPDMLFVVCVGPESLDASLSDVYPAGISAPNVLLVSAVDRGGGPVPFTSTVDSVVLHAAALGIEGPVPTGVGTLSRVTLGNAWIASAQATNIAGKVLAVKPSLTPADVIEILGKTSELCPNELGIKGKRILNAKRAVEAARAR